MYKNGRSRINILYTALKEQLKLNYTFIHKKQCDKFNGRSIKQVSIIDLKNYESFQNILPQCMNKDVFLTKNITFNGHDLKPGMILKLLFLKTMVNRAFI